MKKKLNSYVYLRVLNVSYYKLILRLNKLGINIYDYKLVNNNIIIKVKYIDYIKIKKYLITYDVKLEKYVGNIYYKEILRKYNISLIFIILSILFIVLTSNIIVDIKFNITDKKIINKVNDKLSEYDVYKFSFKKSYSDIQEIKKNILLDLKSDIQWLEITRKGMVYTIDIEKNIESNIDNKDEYCNIYASKDGLIKDIILNEGVANVTLNDYVYKGDLLISGDIYFNDEIVSHVCANATVMAEVWYKVNISVPLVEYITKRTGKVRNNIILNYDDYDVKIFKDRLDNYESSKRLFFDALGIKLYLVKDYEITKEKNILTENEALEKAKINANEKINKMIKDGDFIVKQKVLQKYINNSTIDVEIFVVTNENISVKGLNE